MNEKGLSAGQMVPGGYNTSAPGWLSVKKICDVSSRDCIDDRFILATRSAGDNACRVRVLNALRVSRV